MSKICVWSACGGVGKTTTSVHLSDTLYRNEYDVLTIDLDPQEANLSDYILPSDNAEPLVESLVSDGNIRDSITKRENSFDYISATGELSSFESLVASNNISVGELLLDAELREIEDEYDYIIIDTPATLNLLVDNALVASDGVLVPMEMTKKGRRSVEEVRDIVHALESQLQKARPEFSVDILGVVPNMVDNTNVAQETIKHIDENIENVELIDIEIPDYAVVNKAWASNKTVFDISEEGKLKEYEQSIVDKYDQLGNFITEKTEVKAT